MIDLEPSGAKIDPNTRNTPVSPSQPKYSLADHYKQAFDNELAKRKEGDRKYILTNLLKRNDSYIKGFIENLIESAEMKYDATVSK